MTITNKKIIICSGDSFTAGDELAADTIIPGYTSHLHVGGEPRSKEDELLYKELQSKTKNMFYDGTFKNFEKLGKEKAWPAYLEKLTGIKVINCSRFGISNEEIVHRAMFEYDKAVKDYLPSEILILIMPTQANRIGYPLYDKKYGGDFNFQSFNAHHDIDSVLPEYMRHLYKYHVAYSTDTDNIWRSLSHLLASKVYFETMRSDIKFVESGMWGFSFKNTTSLSSVRSDVFLKMIEFSARMVDLGKGCNSVLPGFHYAEVVHKEFAEKLLTVL